MPSGFMYYKSPFSAIFFRLQAPSITRKVVYHYCLPNEKLFFVNLVATAKNDSVLNKKLLQRVSKCIKYQHLARRFPAGIYQLRVNNRNTRTRCEICSNLSIKTPERHQWRRSGIFIVNFQHISHLVLVFLLLTLNM